ncbi:MAG: hypothetical protein K6A41_07240, partial [Bacteroidales bacterium]|nr:hypothetical protein [Bacteroidales bacterium]
MHSIRKKDKFLTFRIAAMAVLILQFFNVGAQSYHDCTPDGHPIYTYWGFPQTVCAGQQINFSVGYDETVNTMVLAPFTPKVDSAQRMFIPDGIACGDENSCVYRSPITFTGYTGTISSADDIRYVLLNLEHSNAGDLYIGLECPTGQMASIMKAGNNITNSCVSALSWNVPQGWSVNGSKFTDFGLANSTTNVYDCDSLQNPPGTGWDYCWSSNSTLTNNGYIYPAANITSGKYNPSVITADIPSPLYQPEDDFSTLIGCPINGTWNIVIVDVRSNNNYNGYLFDWEIVFDEDVLTTGGGTIDSASVVVPGSGGTLDNTYFAYNGSDTTFIFTAPSGITSDMTITDTLRVFDPATGCWYDTVFSVTVLATGDSVINATICHADLPYSVPGPGTAFAGQRFTETGQHTVTFPNGAANGCDSTVTLNLIVLEEPDIDITTNPSNAVICEGDTITLTATTDCESETLLYEDFSELVDFCDTCDDISNYNPHGPTDPGSGVLELSAFPSILTDFPTRQYAYPAGDAIKLGKGMVSETDAYVGYITSRPLNLSSPFIVTLSTKGWGTRRGKVVVSIDNGVNEQSFITSNDDWPGTYTSKTLYFPAATNQSTITIHTDTILPSSGTVIQEGYRFFIDDIQISRQCHYLWNTGDTTLTISGTPANTTTYTITITSDYGCFSTASQEITVHHPNNTAQTVEECGSYTWNGHTYTESGTYYYQHTDANGCEQVDTLYLTIKDIPDVQITGNTNIFEGQSTTLTATAAGAESYEWSTGNNTNVLNTGALSANTTYTVTATAENGCTGTATVTVNVTPCGSWQLVTDASQLSVGDQIVITNADANLALSTTQRTKNRASVAITPDSNNITINGNVQVITLEQGTVNNTFAFNVGSGYLYAASSSNNYLMTQVNNNANGSWDIDIATDGNATIIAQGDNSRNWLRYHIPGGGTDSVHLFSCYSSGQGDVHIYKLFNFHSDTTAIACGSFTWHDSTYTSSGDYNYNTTSSVSGCDSTVTLHLTIKPAPTIQISTLPDLSMVCTGDSIVLTAATDCGGTEVLLEEGFDGLAGNSLSTSGSNTEINISDLPNFTESSRVYKAGDAIRIGSSSNIGSIKTINLPLENDFTVSIFAKKWVNATKNTILSISAGSQSHNITITTTDYSEQQIHFNSETSNTPILISTTTGTGIEKRGFIDSISVSKNAPCDYSWYTSSGEISSDLSTTVTPSSTGWYYFSVTSSEGCIGRDSVLVVVNEATAGNTTVVACDSYTWYGETHSTSGDYVHTFENGNAAGCDSVVTLHLTINHGTHNVETQDVCESYEWHGSTYTVSGEYTYAYTNGDGCPSVDTLKLT